MLTRRLFINGSAAAVLFPLAAKLTLAAAPGDHRFVCVVLRGAMDGLDVVRPIGDNSYAALRPDAASEKNVDLNGFFAVHPSLAPTEPLFKNKELSFVHAVATPYRARSHFEGQDVLEQGGPTSTLPDGWLNRTLSLVPKVAAADIGMSPSLLLSGKMPVMSWYPERNIDLKADSFQFLERLYADDPLLSKALAGIEKEQSLPMTEEDSNPKASPEEVARLAGKFLNDEARIAVFSITGWDTHVQQQNRLARLLKDLSTTLLALRETLGANWQRTIVVMCSEFGRTVRINGTQGTDHGTGGLAIVAGGLLANGQGGKVLGKWPGLSNLYEDRDLMPTSDVRLYIGSLLADLYGINRSQIASTVFPGLDLPAGTRLI